MEALRSCLNMKVFVDTDDDLRLARRCASPPARGARLRRESSAAAAPCRLLAGRSPGEGRGRLFDANAPKRAGSACCHAVSALAGGAEPSPCAALVSGRVARARGRHTKACHALSCRLRTSTAPMLGRRRRRPPVRGARAHELRARLGRAEYSGTWRCAGATSRA